jgi:hypothetical protein
LNLNAARRDFADKADDALEQLAADVPPGHFRFVVMAAGGFSWGGISIDGDD